MRINEESSKYALSNVKIGAYGERGGGPSSGGTRGWRLKFLRRLSLRRSLRDQGRRQGNLHRDQLGGWAATIIGIWQTRWSPARHGSLRGPGWGLSPVPRAFQSAASYSWNAPGLFVFLHDRPMKINIQSSLCVSSACVCRHVNTFGHFSTWHMALATPSFRHGGHRWRYLATSPGAPVCFLPGWQRHSNANTTEGETCSATVNDIHSRLQGRDWLVMRINKPELLCDLN